MDLHAAKDMRPPGFARKVKFFLRQATILGFLVFVPAEIALRIYDHYFPSFVFYQTSYERFRGKPFANDWDFKLNSLGFKDEEFAPKREDAYRIVGIGDSFAFGVVPYQHNYLTLIESRLRLQHSHVELLNIGIPGTGPKDYLSIFVNEGLALQPDMVLVSFFIGNDFQQSKRRMHDYSYVVALLRSVVQLTKNYQGRVIHPDPDYCDDCPNFAEDKYVAIEAKRSRIYHKEFDRFPRLLDGAAYYLSKIQEVCDDEGIDLLVAIIPDVVQINPDLWDKVRTARFASSNLDEWDLERPNRDLSSRLEASQIDHIDLYEHFADAAHPRLYRPRDTHWNIAGNRLASDILERSIRKYLVSDGSNEPSVFQSDE